MPISQDVRKGIEGQYPYYGPTGILGYIDHFRISGTVALIGEDGDHFLKFADRDMTLLVSGQFNVNNHAHIVQGSATCLTEWFYTYMRGRCLIPHLTRQGVGRFKLTKASLESIPILIPPLSEQRQIHETITRWDQAIILTERLIAARQERLAWLMQQLLTGKHRLPGYHGLWERTHLGNHIREVSLRNRGRQVQQVLSVTNDKGFVLPEDRFSRVIASADLQNYKIVRRGQFAYNPSRINVGSLALLEDKQEGVISPMYVVFACKGAIDPHYLKSWLSSHEGKAKILAACQGSVRDTVSFDSLASLIIRLPCSEEQLAIVSLLKTAESEISLLEEQRSVWTKQKKGLMQQLLTGKRRVKLLANSALDARTRAK